MMAVSSSGFESGLRGFRSKYELTSRILKVVITVANDLKASLCVDHFHSFQTEQKNHRPHSEPSLSASNTVSTYPHVQDDGSKPWLRLQTFLTR
jgi:hypothetical protein